MIWKFKLYGFLKNFKFFEAFLYLFLLSNGIPFFHIGLLIAVRETTQMIFEIPTGVLADLFGKRRTMMLCFISYIFSFILFFIGSSIWVFVPAFVLFGFGEALRTGTHKAIILDYLDRNNLSHEKTKIYGLTRSWSLLGSAISVLLAAAIVFCTSSYEYIFAASIIPYVIGLSLMYSYPKYLDQKIGKDFYRKFIQETRDHIRDVIRSFRNNFSLIRSLGSSTYFDATFKIIKDYIQPIIELQIILAGGLLTGFFIMNEKQEVALIIGGAYFLIYIVASLSSRWAHRFEKSMFIRSRALNLLYMIFALLLIVVGLLQNFEQFIPIIILFIVMYMVINLRRPIIIGYLGDHMKKDQRATIFSIESQLTAVFAIILAPLLGLFADILGIEYVFLFGAIMMILLFPILILKE